MIYDMIVIYSVDSNGLLKKQYFIIYCIPHPPNDIPTFFILKLYFPANENL